MKSYTDLEQSKKLAEILPLESADVFYRNNEVDVKLMWEHNAHKVKYPCWSLAALFDLLPKEINVLGTAYSIDIHTKNEEWFIDYKCNNEEFVGVYSNIFIDACYEMILELKEKKLL